MISRQALPLIAVEVTRPDDHQPQIMLRDYCLAPKVVEPPLFSAGNAADRRSTVKEGHGLVMLPLTKLDDEMMSLVPRVYRQLSAMTVAARVAYKPREAVLPFGAFAKEFVAQVDDIRFVAFAANHGETVTPTCRASAAAQMLIAGTVDVGGSSREGVGVTHRTVYAKELPVAQHIAAVTCARRG